MLNEEMKREIILDNFNNPINKGLLEDKSYNIVSTNNESCVDKIDLGIKIENNILKDIRFDGEACVITTSTTSIMIKELIGKPVDQALELIENYKNMLNEKSFNENIVGEAIVYKNSGKQLNRKKCALLTWDGVYDFLKSLKQNNNSF
ncbi:MAG: Fe-S cluster assembly sulfur transfer protein SufU [Bacilli bacterium]